MKIVVDIVNAFIDGHDGGNPAGVVLNADNLCKADKQNIARKAGLSETAFVSVSSVADFKLEFFTPTRQIAHCGHATVATFSYLKRQGKISGTTSSKETIDGTRLISFSGDSAYMEQKSPVFSDMSHLTSDIARAMGISPNQITCAPYKVNTGNSFFVIQVSDREVLRTLSPDYDAISQISEEHDLIGFYPFTTKTNYDSSDANARMFAPRYGIQEEAATGMAAGPLACYLYSILGNRKSVFVVEQGFEMAKKSQSIINVHLNLDDSVSGEKAISSLMAGGEGIKTGSLELEI